MKVNTFSQNPQSLFVLEPDRYEYQGVKTLLVRYQRYVVIKYITTLSSVKETFFTSVKINAETNVSVTDSLSTNR